jgi:hypothetical protein
MPRDEKSGAEVQRPGPGRATNVVGRSGVSPVSYQTWSSLLEKFWYMT